MKGLVIKLIGIILMFLAPYIAGKALWEYFQVVFMHSKPSYPFGSNLMEITNVKDIAYLSSYSNQMLTVGLVFLAISVLIYLAMLIKSLFKLAQLAIVLSVVYAVYHVTFKI